MDWGTGRYETTAAQLAPVSPIAADRLDPRPGEHVVDVGCGTGNASLVVAARGARVTAVDPAPRLRGVAEQRLRDAGADAAVVAGEAAAIPLEDGSADALISVFGVIFAPDAELAAIEMARVSRPRARIVVTAWVPAGPFFATGRVRREAMTRATGQPLPDPFPWHDPDALAHLFGPHGFAVDVQAHELVITAPSAEAYVTREAADHPMWTAARQALPAADVAALEAEVLAIYAAENTDPTAFRITSPYVSARLIRG